MAVRLDAVAVDRGATPVLVSASMEVAAGEIVAVTGPSGSGKSTLLQVIAGILGADAGSTVVLGHDFSSMRFDERSAVRLRQIGVVAQHGDLLPELSVGRNVELPLLLQGRRGDERIDRVLASVGLGGLAPRRPEGLSGGERQRVALARALIGDPDLVVADEPTGALDEGQSEAIGHLLVEQCRRAGAATVVATHDLVLAARCDRTYQLRRGVLERC